MDSLSKLDQFTNPNFENIKFILFDLVILSVASSVAVLYLILELYKVYSWHKTTRVKWLIDQKDLFLSDKGDMEESYDTEMTEQENNPTIPMNRINCGFYKGRKVHIKLIDSLNFTPHFEKNSKKLLNLFSLRKNQKNEKSEQWSFNSQQISMIKSIMQLDHVNLNKVCGVCFYSGSIMLVSVYEQRGSLQDLHDNQELYEIDDSIRLSMVEDLVQAMVYISASSNTFGCHGALNPSCCLVSTDWRLRVAELGVIALRVSISSHKSQMVNSSVPMSSMDGLNGTFYQSHAPNKDTYPVNAGVNDKYENFVAPELSKFPQSIRHILANTKSDVYSFGKILRLLFHLDHVTVDDLMKNQFTFHSLGQTFNNKYDRYCFVNDLEDISFGCLKVDPDMRLSFASIMTQFRRLTSTAVVGWGGESTLDRVAKQVHYTANNVPKIVEKSLDEMRSYCQRYQSLLNESFPLHVSQLIRNNIKYEPEYLDNVSIMFIDMMNFDEVCQNCTPLQIVSLLNSVYTLIDRILEQMVNYDMYKVETIGDVYVIACGITGRRTSAPTSEGNDSSTFFKPEKSTFTEETPRLSRGQGTHVMSDHEKCAAILELAIRLRNNLKTKLSLFRMSQEHTPPQSQISRMSIASNSNFFQSPSIQSRKNTAPNQKTSIQSDPPDFGTSSLNEQHLLSNIKLRFGISSGPIVCAVIGNLTPRFCLIGDTMNTAARMKSAAKEFEIVVSAHSKELFDQYKLSEASRRVSIENIDSGVEKSSIRCDDQKEFENNKKHILERKDLSFEERVVPIKGKGNMSIYCLKNSESSMIEQME